MATKSLKVLTEQWFDKHYRYENLELRTGRNDIGGCYSGFAASYEEGYFQVMGTPRYLTITLYRDEKNTEKDFVSYEFNQLKPARAALEVLASAPYQCDRRYKTFAEMADDLELILEFIPAQRVTRR